MLTAVAFCPCPPLLHPALGTGAPEALSGLRTACLDAVRAAAVDLPADVVVVIGSDDRTGAYPVGSRGSLQPYGADVVLGDGDGDVVLPLPLALGVWLCAEARVEVPVQAFGVARDDGPARCTTVGAGIADRAERVALVVMGDGSARRDAKAPGRFDPRAEPFDRGVAEALAAPDRIALAAIDPVVADELMVDGRAPWQVATAAASAIGAEAEWAGTLLHHEAPHGVGYLVATWLPA